VRRLDPGDPTDLEILRALATRGDQPASADALAPLLGLPAARVPVRLRSLVTLGYVACPVSEPGRGAGYRLSGRGRNGLLRRAEPPPAPPPADPAAPAAL
jgi:predicted ArsR family transcriptional regulator